MSAGGAFTVGTLAQVASLAPLAWCLAGGAPVAGELWQGAAALGLAGVGLAAGAAAWGLARLALGAWRGGWWW